MNFVAHKHQVHRNIYLKIVFVDNHTYSERLRLPSRTEYEEKFDTMIDVPKKYINATWIMKKKIKSSSLVDEKNS